MWQPPRIVSLTKTSCWYASRLGYTLDSLWQIGLVKSSQTNSCSGRLTPRKSIILLGTITGIYRSAIFTWCNVHFPGWRRPFWFESRDGADIWDHSRFVNHQSVPEIAMWRSMLKLIVSRLHVATIIIALISHPFRYLFESIGRTRNHLFYHLSAYQPPAIGQLKRSAAQWWTERGTPCMEQATSPRGHQRRSISRQSRHYGRHTTQASSFRQARPRWAWSTQCCECARSSHLACPRYHMRLVMSDRACREKTSYLHLHNACSLAWDDTDLLVCPVSFSNDHQYCLIATYSCLEPPLATIFMMIWGPLAND